MMGSVSKIQKYSSAHLKAPIQNDIWSPYSSWSDFQNKVIQLPLLNPCVITIRLHINYVHLHQCGYYIM